MATDGDAVARLAEAVSGVYADASARDVRLGRQVQLADMVARSAELRARQRAKYGDPADLYDRLLARNGLSARVWC